MHTIALFDREPCLGFTSPNQTERTPHETSRALRCYGRRDPSISYPHPVAEKRQIFRPAQSSGSCDNYPGHNHNHGANNNDDCSTKTAAYAGQPRPSNHGRRLPFLGAGLHRPPRRQSALYQWLRDRKDISRPIPVRPVKLGRCGRQIWPSRSCRRRCSRRRSCRPRRYGMEVFSGQRVFTLAAQSRKVPIV